MIKAIFVRGDYGKQSDLEELNRELKECKSIIKEMSTGYGTVLIVDIFSRKEKLEKLNEISNKK